MSTFLSTLKYLYRILTTRTDSQYSCPRSEFTGKMAVLRYCWFRSLPLWHQIKNFCGIICNTVLNSKGDLTGRPLIMRYNTKHPKILNINLHFVLHENYKWTRNNSDPNPTKPRCLAKENTLIFLCLSLGTVLDPHVVAGIFIIMVNFIFSQTDCTNYVEPRMIFLNNNLHVDIQQTISAMSTHRNIQ
jgi:hypothetical protein